MTGSSRVAIVGILAHGAQVTRRRTFHFHRLACALIAAAMLMRMLIPAGWMPTADAAGMMQISMCTGMGVQTAWIDRSGKIHHDAPGQGHHDRQPCGFGALGIGLDDLPRLALPLPVRHDAVGVRPLLRAVSIGRGLAAPPPPSTGPPVLN